MNSEDYQTCVNFLKNQIFLGHYSGRHRVDDIDDFRDVINLHSTEEQLKSNIDAVLNIVNTSGTSVWVAISDLSRNGAYSLWVQLDGIAFGYYWFQIKHVRMTNKELFCVVSVLRNVPAELVNPTFSFSQGFESAMQALRSVGSGRIAGETNVSTDRNARNASREETNLRREENPRREESAPRGSRTENRNNGENRDRQENNPIGSARTLSSLKDFRRVTFDRASAVISDEELRHGVIRTLIVCCFVGIVGAMNLIYESLIVVTNIVVVTGDVTIRGIHAVSRLIESLSPILLGLLNFVGKLVTGLYILIAMIFGCTPYMPAQQKAPPPRRQALMYR